MGGALAIPTHIPIKQERKERRDYAGGFPPGVALGHQGKAPQLNKKEKKILREIVPSSQSLSSILFFFYSIKLIHNTILYLYITGRVTVQFKN